MLSPFLFLLVVNWITRQRNRDSLDLWKYADDLALLSHSLNQMQAKTKSLEEVAMSVGLQVSQDKTIIMSVKTDSLQSVTLAKGSIEEIKEFTYLRSVRSKSMTEQGVKAWMYSQHSLQISGYIMEVKDNWKGNKSRRSIPT